MPKAVSKYAEVLPGLPKLPPADASYQDKVDKVKIVLAGIGSAEQLVVAYAALRAEKDALDAVAYALNLRLEAVSQLLTESQEKEDEGWGRYGVAANALRLPSGETLRIQHEPYGQVKDKEAFRLWCVAPTDKCMTCGSTANIPAHDELHEGGYVNHPFKPGGGYERQLQLWPTTMNAVARERLLDGQAPPDGVEVFARTKVVFSKAGAKGNNDD